MTAIEDEQAANEDDDESFSDSLNQRAKRVRLAQLKELLTSPVLGTA
jgi:hypothetical protein